MGILLEISTEQLYSFYKDCMSEVDFYCIMGSDAKRTPIKGALLDAVKNGTATKEDAKKISSVYDDLSPEQKQEFNVKLKKNNINISDIKALAQNLEEFTKNINSGYKMLDSETVLLYQDDIWTIISPLSAEASRRHCANSKWCTAGSSYRHYFPVYSTSKNACLIAFFNKKDDSKTFQIAIDENKYINNACDVYDAPVTMQWIESDIDMNIYNSVVTVPFIKFAVAKTKENEGKEEKDNIFKRLPFSSLMRIAVKTYHNFHFEHLEGEDKEAMLETKDKLEEIIETVHISDEIFFIKKKGDKGVIANIEKEFLISKIPVLSVKDRLFDDKYVVQISIDNYNLLKSDGTFVFQNNAKGYRVYFASKFRCFNFEDGNLVFFDEKGNDVTNNVETFNGEYTYVSDVTFIKCLGIFCCKKEGINSSKIACNIGIDEKVNDDLEYVLENISEFPQYREMVLKLIYFIQHYDKITDKNDKKAIINLPITTNPFFAFHNDIFSVFCNGYIIGLAQITDEGTSNFYEIAKQKYRDEKNNVGVFIFEDGSNEYVLLSMKGEPSQILRSKGIARAVLNLEGNAISVTYDAEMGDGITSFFCYDKEHWSEPSPFKGVKCGAGVYKFGGLLYNEAIDTKYYNGYLQGFEKGRRTEITAITFKVRANGRISRLYNKDGEPVNIAANKFFVYKDKNNMQIISDISTGRKLASFRSDINSQFVSIDPTINNGFDDSAFYTIAYDEYLILIGLTKNGNLRFSVLYSLKSKMKFSYNSHYEIEAGGEDPNNLPGIIIPLLADCMSIFGFENEFKDEWTKECKSAVAFLKDYVKNTSNKLNSNDIESMVKESVKRLFTHYLNESNTVEQRSPQWVYLGVFLDEESKKRLKDLAEGLNIIPDDSWKSYCHHMTLAYNDKSQTAENMFSIYGSSLGANVSMKAREIGISDKAIAVKIKWGHATLNKVSHITIAVSPDGKPVDSNNITDWKPLDKPITLTGQIGYFGKDKQIHFSE